MRKTVRAAVVTVALLAAAGSVGCIGADAQHRDALYNPSPAELTLTQNVHQVENGMAVTTDTNTRLFWDDMGRFWLFDRPSHLTPVPMR